MVNMGPPIRKNPHESLVDLRWAGALPVGVIKVGDPVAVTPSLPTEAGEQTETGGEEPVGLGAPIVELED